MNADALRITLASGVIGAGSIILVVLAVAIAYAHGRYIPVWLPDLGTVGAYLFRLLWVGGAPVSVSASLSLVFCIGVAWLVHRYLIVPFLDEHDYLSPLLLGLGLGFGFQGSASLLGSGLSEHFPGNGLQQQWYPQAFGFAVHASDAAGLVVGLFASLGLYMLFRSSRTGLRLRAVMANRDWARSLGIPVRRIDAVVVTIYTVLAVAGACLYGNRFDLQPTMMFYPGLTAIAAAVTAGFVRPFLAVPIAAALMVVEIMVGLSPSLAQMQRAVPFVAVVVILLIRSFARPQAVEAGS